MSEYLVVYQFGPPAPKVWSQSKIQSYMSTNGGHYVSRGIYILISSDSAENIRDAIVKKAELTEKDFGGVFPISGEWSSTGHSQKGFTQAVWPDNPT